MFWQRKCFSQIESVQNLTILFHNSLSKTEANKAIFKKSYFYINHSFLVDQKLVYIS